MKATLGKARESAEQPYIGLVPASKRRLVRGRQWAGSFVRGGTREGSGSVARGVSLRVQQWLLPEERSIVPGR